MASMVPVLRDTTVGRPQVPQCHAPLAHSELVQASLKLVAALSAQLATTVTVVDSAHPKVNAHQDTIALQERTL